MLKLAVASGGGYDGVRKRVDRATSAPYHPIRRALSALSRAESI